VRNPRCHICSLVHPPFTSCAEARLAALQFILSHAGREDTCRACGAKLYWTIRVDGTYRAYNELGRPHISGSTCPSPAEAERVEDYNPPVEQRIRSLLLAIAPASRCQCGTPIFFVKYGTGKSAPYTIAGLVHFADCPAALRFRRPRVPVGAGG